MTAVDDFLLSYGSEKTRNGYKVALGHFFDFVKTTPDDYIDSDSNFEIDVRRFAQYLSGEYPAPKTFFSYITVVKMFFEYHQLQVNPVIWKQFKRLVKGTRARTQDRIPTDFELKKMMAYADLKMKAAITFLLSSGMRIGELLQLMPADVDFGQNPTRVKLRPEYTKTGEPRTTFISDEATMYLKEWLSYKREYLENVAKTTNLPHVRKKMDDERLFPFTIQGLRNSFVLILEKTGLDQRDPTTNRYVVHFHVFRKYFRSKMGLKMPSDIVETLMGHEGYLSEYRHYDDSELASYYTKAMDAITILEKSDAALIEELEKEIARRDKKIDTIDKRVESLEKIEWLSEILSRLKKSGIGPE